jgi:hypothetical protein
MDEAKGNSSPLACQSSGSVLIYTLYIMSRDTRLKRTVNRAIDRRLAEDKHTKPKPRTLLNAVLYIVGIPGIIVAILTLLPRASVSPDELHNPSDPFSAPFIVANDGYVDLNDVTFTCSPVKVLSSRQWEIRADDGAGFSDASFNVGTLGPDGRTTVFCNLTRFISVGPIQDAHIRIILSFRPEWLPFRRSIKRDFVLSKDASGHFHWLHSSD